MHKYLYGISPIFTVVKEYLYLNGRIKLANDCTNYISLQMLPFMIQHSFAI